MFTHNNQTQEGAEPSPSFKSNINFTAGIKNITKIIGGYAFAVLLMMAMAPTSVSAGWYNNPSGCNTDTQWIAAEKPHYCIDKKVKVKSVATATVESTVPVASAVTSATTWRDNPNNCDRDVQWIAAESPFYCINIPGAIASVATTASVPVAATPAATPVYSSGGCNLVYNYSNWNQAVAYAVCMAESGGNANAYNPEAHNGCGGSVGLFQIGCVHGWGSSFDPATNVAFANQLYSQQGWYPWGAYTNGSYYAYL